MLGNLPRAPKGFRVGYALLTVLAAHSKLLRLEPFRALEKAIWQDRLG
tara:strand:+ start:955 stop:1098 length:144 start_codon:yes stop_codon:yes gene_type:complete